MSQRFKSISIFLAAITASFTPSCNLMAPVLAVLPAKPLMNHADHLMPKIHETHYVSYDNDSLGYKKWLPPQAPPEIVIIGVHGISGHAGDYENLGKHLLSKHQNIALYAPETRGQGMDPKVKRRGDIKDPDQWYQDLNTFTGLVRNLHPKAKIIWFGESMGSLITAHAYLDNVDNLKLPQNLQPDGIVLSSPILDVNSKVPSWQRAMLKATAAILPKLKISLETLSSDGNKKVTKKDIHEQQSAINPWYIKRYTLRLLLDLADMADSMDEAAGKITCPLLIIHGGKDLFTGAKTVQNFHAGLPAEMDKTRLYYSDSYHLLMYDHHKKAIFADISKWLTAQN